MKLPGGWSFKSIKNVRHTASEAESPVGLERGQDYARGLDADKVLVYYRYGS